MYSQRFQCTGCRVALGAKAPTGGSGSCSARTENQLWITLRVWPSSYIHPFHPRKHSQSHRCELSRPPRKRSGNVSFHARMFPWEQSLQFKVRSPPDQEKIYTRLSQKPPQVVWHSAGLPVSPLSVPAVLCMSAAHFD